MQNSHEYSIFVENMFLLYSVDVANLKKNVVYFCEFSILHYEKIMRLTELHRIGINIQGCQP